VVTEEATGPEAVPATLELRPRAIEAGPLTNVLNLDEMLAADDVEYVTVEIPEWGGVVRLGSINADAMLDYAEQNNAPGGARSSTIRLIMLSMVDAAGVRLVPKEDLARRFAAFAKKDVRVMNKLLDATLKLNGIRQQPALVKNDLSEVSPVASLTV
jgi:hypothetical protein